MKKCPYCAEEIKDEAIVCRYCGRDLPISDVPATVTQKETPTQVQVSIWKQGAKASILITILYAIYTFFTSPNPAELMGSLTVGLIATFIFWWLICSIIVWMWRRLGNSPVVKILLIIGFVFTALYLISLIPNNASPFVIPSATPTEIPPTKSGGFVFGGGSPSSNESISTPTLKSSCLSWEQVDESFAGKTICVSGIVYEIKQVKVKGEYLTITQERIYFSENKNAFFLLDDQYSYPNLKTGDCVVASGKIETDSKHVPFINLKGELKTCN